MMAAVQGAGSNKDYIAKLTMYLTRKDNHFDMMMSILAQVRATILHIVHTSRLTSG